MSVAVVDGTTGPAVRSRDEVARELEHEVVTLIRRLKRVVAERARAVDVRLQPSSYLMLVWLVDAGPVRASTMVEAMHIDKAAVSRHLHNLEELGLVQRTPDPQDGRATLVTANEAAADRLRAAFLDQRRLFDDRLGSWTTADLDQFVSMLGRYNASLEPENLRATCPTD